MGGITGLGTVIVTDDVPPSPVNGTRWFRPADLVHWDWIYDSATQRWLSSNVFVYNYFDAITQIVAKAYISIDDGYDLYVEKATAGFRRQAGTMNSTNYYTFRLGLVDGTSNPDTNTLDLVMSTIDRTDLLFDSASFSSKIFDLTPSAAANRLIDVSNYSEQIILGQSVTFTGSPATLDRVSTVLEMRKVRVASS